MDRLQALSEYRAELFRRQLSNAENFDKAILTYATGALALSLGFLKDYVPISKASCPFLLYASWTMFALCIMSTIVSYLIGQHAISKQYEIADNFYKSQEQEPVMVRNHATIYAERCNTTSGVLFCLAVATTTLFVFFNLKVADMSSKDLPESVQRIIDGQTRIIRSATPPPMTNIPIAPVSQTTQESQQAEQSTPSDGSSSK